MNRCLEKVGPVKFAGESTLGHVYEAFLQHLNKTEYFWPTRHDLDARKVYGRLDLLQRNDHSDFHGIDMVNKNLFDEIHNHKRTANMKFENVVILQGANDAARYSIEKFRERDENFRRNRGKIPRNEQRERTDSVEAFSVGDCTDETI